MTFSIQRPGYPICPPAVARHLVFRLPTAQNPRWKIESGARRRLWSQLCDRLGAHLTDLRVAYGGGGVTIVPFNDEADVDNLCFSAGSSSLVPIKPDPGVEGYRLRVRLDVHTELFSLTYIFDRIRRDSLLGDHIASLPGDVQGKSPASDWLFNKLWDSTLPAAEVLARWRQDPGKHHHLGNLITDFRGIVICPTEDWPMGPPSLDQTDTTKEPEKKLDERLAKFAQANASLIRAIADPHGLDRSPDAECDDSAGPGCVSGGEPVVCGMIDGKALYAAALGEWGKDVETPHPIRHLLVYAGHSYSQLGRLVRRMQVLGELRHAALMDFDTDPHETAAGLIEASRRIRVLGRRINIQTRLITRATERENAPGKAVSGRKGAVNQLGKKTPPMTLLQLFVDDLASISRLVDGGLTHRVEQSRYYAQEFEKAITHLRLVPIDNWQPYNAFVQRYVMHLFARIDRIGNRYEALGRRVDRLLFFQQAKLLDTYTERVNQTVADIHGATKALNASAARQIAATEALNDSATQQITATKALKGSADQQIDVSKEQSGLLRSAEQFAVVFLIYYVGTVTFHLFDLHHRLPAVLVSPDWVHDGFLIGWAALIGYFTVLLIRHHRRGKRARAAESSDRAKGAAPRPAPTSAQPPGRIAK